MAEDRATSPVMVTRRITAWLRRASRIEEDKGNFWVAGRMAALADWMERGHVKSPAYCEFCGAGNGIPHEDWCPRRPQLWP